MAGPVIAETFLELIKDPNHWGFELTVEACTAAVGFVVGRNWVARHDEKRHPKPLTEADVRRIVDDMSGQVPGTGVIPDADELIGDGP